MAEIKSLKQASDKWVRRASVAGPDYQTGVANPRRAWTEASVAGESNYKSGVTKAAAAGMYGKGVKAVGEAKWKDRATKLGPGRFAEGVSVAVDDWQKGFAPYHQTITAIKLPDRGPKGDPKNIQRVAAIATALRTVKEKG